MKKILLFILLSSWAFGQLVATSLDTLEFDETSGQYAMCIAFNDSIVAVAYMGASNYGTVQMIPYNTTTRLLETAIDTFVFYGAVTPGMAIDKMNDTTLVINYIYNSDGYVQTLHVDSNYDVTAIDTLVYYGADAVEYPDIVKLDETHFLTNTHPVGIVSFSMDVDGANIAALDTIEVLNQYAYPQRIYAPTDSTAIALTHHGSLTLYSYKIDSDGLITFVDDLFLLGNCVTTQGGLLDDNHVLAAFNNSGNQSYAWIATWTEGTMATIAETDEVRHQYGAISGGGWGNFVTMTDSTALLASKVESDLTINVFKWDDSYVFDETDMDDTINWGTIIDVGSYIGFIDKLNDSTAVIAYGGDDADGFMQIIDLSEGGAGGWAHYVNEVESPTKVNGVEDYTKVNGVE